jgi:AbrB family looped-hinge helix DNA binding protein
MPDILTVSAKGQITLPADIRVDFGINAGDKVFAEKTEIGYVIKRPKKGLMDYAGFIKADKVDLEAEEKAVKDGAAARCFGEG